MKLFWKKAFPQQVII